MSTEEIIGSPEFARDMARWRKEENAATGTPAEADTTATGNKVAEYTALFSRGDWLAFHHEERAEYPVEPAEYPCFIRAGANYQEGTDYHYLYRADIEAMVRIIDHVARNFSDPGESSKETRQ